jgi:Rieske Fe-S protein
MGCEVFWSEPENRYRCRCHEGLFDAQGQPVAGPPPRPLRTLPVTLEGDVAVVGTGQGGA